MKICANCGNQIPDGASFCNNCGSSVTEGNVSSDKDSIIQAPSANAAGAIGTVGAAGDASSAGTSGGQQEQGFNNGNFQQGPFQQPPYQQAPYQQGPYQQPYVRYDPTDHTSEFDAKDIADNKLFALIPYFSLLLGLIAGIYLKESAYMKFHIRNSIIFTVAEVLVAIICIIPFLGWVIGFVCFIVLGIFKIVAVIWVFQGKAKEIPVLNSIGFLK